MRRLCHKLLSALLDLHCCKDRIRGAAGSKKRDLAMIVATGTVSLIYVYTDGIFEVL